MCQRTRERVGYGVVMAKIHFRIVVYWLSFPFGSCDFLCFKEICSRTIPIFYSKDWKWLRKSYVIYASEASYVCFSINYACDIKINARSTQENIISHTKKLFKLLATLAYKTEDFFGGIKNNQIKESREEFISLWRPLWSVGLSKRLQWQYIDYVRYARSRKVSNHSHFTLCGA